MNEKNKIRESLQNIEASESAKARMWRKIAAASKPKSAPSFVKWIPLTAGACAVFAATILILPFAEFTGEDITPYTPEEPPSEIVSFIPDEQESVIDLTEPVVYSETHQFYTRDRIFEFANYGPPAYNADTPQQHRQGERPDFDNPGNFLPNYEGMVCSNTGYFIIDERRVCYICGYIFTQAQDEAIGLDPLNPPEPFEAYDKFNFPVDMSIAQVSEWGYWDGGYHGHTGIDFAAPRGTEIFAVADGIVTFAEWHGLYGRLIIIRHAENNWQSALTLYAHCDVLFVSEDDTVTQGQVIALVGDSGAAADTHLHFEVTNMFGQSLNPKLFFVWD
jgi:murein DD-endopeptidase MepM/ murein hydrolase activator NlpD